jgi:hypothetical protein
VGTGVPDGCTLGETDVVAEAEVLSRADGRGALPLLQPATNARKTAPIAADAALLSTFNV